MANSFIAVQAVTADKKLDSETLTVGGNTVERERVQIAGAGATEIAVVSAAAPIDWTLPGLHVKVGGMITTDTIHQQGTYLGMEMLAARKDAAGTIATLDGRVAPLQMDGDGNLRVVTATLIPGTTAAALGKAVDAVAGATDTGVVALVVRDDVLATLTPVDGDYTTQRVDSVGATWVTLSTMAQVIGSVAHDSPDTQPPVKIGGFGSAALRTAVTEGDRTDASFDLQGQLRVLAQGAIAHDTADAGNPLKVGGRASSALRTAVTAEDRVDALWDLDGALVTRRTALANIVTGNASNTDGTSTELIAAQAAGVRTYLTRVTVTNAHATTFAYVELKDGTTVKHTIPVPPAGGATLDFDPPLPGTAATAWNFDPSAAVTTLICSAVGYTSKV